MRLETVQGQFSYTHDIYIPSRLVIRLSPRPGHLKERRVTNSIKQKKKKREQQKKKGTLYKLRLQKFGDRLLEDNLFE